LGKLVKIKGTTLGNPPKIQPNRNMHVCAVRTSPKTCMHGLFLIKGGISGQIVKKNNYKGYKVRQPTKISSESERARAHVACFSVRRYVFQI
jgi:hypothetical protein